MEGTLGGARAAGSAGSGELDDIFGRWESRTVVGLTAVLLAAVLERYQERTLAWAGSLPLRVGAWHL